MPKCNEEGCTVLANGICLNGFAELKECSHYSDNVIDKIDEGIIEDEETKDEDVSVHSGLSLFLDDVNRLALEDYTALIMLAGMPDAGKTTALLSIMHLFGTNKQYREFIFAGSNSLVDFEEKAWPSRLASNRQKTKTVRTNDIEPRFLHLKIAEASKPYKKKDILFTDVSGELFRILKDSDKESRGFELAKRADHFTLFFDAHALSNKSDRNATKTAGMDILKSLSKNGVLLPETRIQVVFSRWDFFQKKAEQEFHTAYVDDIKKEVTAIYGTAYEITFHKIASRPDKSPLEFGYGLGELFDLWVSKSRLDFGLKSNENADDPEGLRNMYKYKF